LAYVTITKIVDDTNAIIIQHLKTLDVARDAISYIFKRPVKERTIGAVVVLRDLRYDAITVTVNVSRKPSMYSS
jgi:hypothetical protein